jgi:hypothetical protein
MQIFMGALALVATIALGAMVEPAAAKPKKPSFNGCSAAQIQSPAAAACIRRMERDVTNNHAYYHALFCDAGGMSCCQTDGTRTFACKAVASVGMPRPDHGVRNPMEPGRKVDPGPKVGPLRPPFGAGPPGAVSRPPPPSRPPVLR